MAFKTLRGTVRKIAAKKHAVDAPKRIVLVGMYGPRQLEKWPGYYNYPLYGKDKIDVEAVKGVNELWLFSGAKRPRYFAADCLGVKTREELKGFGYKATGKGHGSGKYLLFKTKKLYAPSRDFAESVTIRTKDFAGQGATQKQLKAYLESPDRKDPLLAKMLPKIVTELPRERLRVCEAAVQLELIGHQTESVAFGRQEEIKVSRRDNKARFEMFRVKTVKMAREIAAGYMESFGLQNAVSFGLPEVDDRYEIWRVPITAKNRERIGEVVIDAVTTEVDLDKSSAKEVLENRLLGRGDQIRQSRCRESVPHVSTLRNTVIFGSSETVLRDLPEGCVDLVFTSPPYYNARPEYADYFSYEDYLNHMKQVIHECGRLLNEGRFFVLNVSPVLIRRTSRNEASRRIAVPFDFHRLFIDEGFEFIDDIIWVKPEGAGWATGRGRRFSADRNPCQYKAVPVTEYVLVYRKKTDKLIDWLIRKHPSQEDIEASKIKDGYEVTNLWRITPAHSKVHPAIFPLELASKVIQYYSFRNDVILDPFGGIGTTGKAAAVLGRRFALVEREMKYIDEIKKDLPNWFPVDAHPDVNWIGTDPVDLKMNNLFLQERPR